jgi:exosortase/archaeosortase family protein
MYLNILYKAAFKKVTQSSTILYCIKFLACYCILYYSTQAIIGLAAPSGYYSSFVNIYMDYPSFLRKSLLYGARYIVSLFGHAAEVVSAYKLTMTGGRGVDMVYSCLGIGLFSFWLAFIFANTGSSAKKACWMIGGIVVIWLLNVLRISLLLIAVNKGWTLPLSIDHHTIFSIAVYLAIFIMIYFFARGDKPHPSA